MLRDVLRQVVLPVTADVRRTVLVLVNVVLRAQKLLGLLSRDVCCEPPPSHLDAVGLDATLVQPRADGVD